MKRNRIIWLMLYILSLVSISFYGGAISYGFFITLTAIPVVSIIYIVYVIFRFRIYQRLDGRSLCANNRSDFYFTLQNEGLLAFSSIRVTFYSDYSTIDGLDDSLEYELAPHSGIKKQTGLICRYRGEYEVGIRRIIVSDFLRLFAISYNNREPLRVNVRPAIVNLDSLNNTVETISSARDSHINATEPDVFVREYASGDDSRMIHWRASAAANKLMVRERIGTQRRGVGIIMDPKRYSNDPGTYIPLENKMLELVIALTLYYIGKNIRVGLCLEGLSADVDGMSGFDAFYDSVCKYDFKEGTDAATFHENVLGSQDITDKKDVCFITPVWNEEAAVFVREISLRGPSVTVYLIGDNPISFPESADDNIIRINVNDELTEVLE